jgi:peptide/nickel transport system permease protein
MKTYVIKRLLLMIPTLVGITLLVYAVVRLAPGDPIEAMIRNQSGNIDPKAMRESADRIRERLGLNDINYWGDDVESTLADLKGEDPAVRVRAAAELKRITRENFGEDPQKWQAWWDVHRFTFTKELIDPAERVVNAFHGYGRWVAHLFQGNFGESIVFRMPKNSPILDYLTALRDGVWGIDGAGIERTVPDLKVRDPQKRAEAEARLRQLTGQDLGPDAAAWQAWWAQSKESRFAWSWWKGLDDLKTTGSKNPFWIILDRLPVTLTLNIIAESLIFLIAIPVGLTAARYRGKWFDYVSSFILLALWSIPVILAGTLLRGYLGKGGSGLLLFPVAGLHDPDYEKFTWGTYLVDLLWHSCLPVVCLTYGGLAYLAKLGRASLLENLRADYVRTARAKGLPERLVVYRHALRNSLLPMITVMALTLPGLLGGSVIVETIFSIQGTGMLFVGAAQAFDLSVIMADTLLYGLLTLVFLLVADILYAWADPRIRYE